MYFLLTTYFYSYFTMYIENSYIRHRHNLLLLFIALGIVNVLFFFITTKSNLVHLILYFINIINSVFFVYLLKDYKPQWGDWGMILYNLTLHLTIVLVFVFSLLNVLEYFNLLTRFNLI